MALYKCVHYYYYFDPGIQFPWNKKNYAMRYKKYKNPAGMNLTPPPPSQNSHAVRWHCAAESERRVAYYYYTFVGSVRVDYPSAFERSVRIHYRIASSAS